jgi:hypothetical protein
MRKNGAARPPACVRFVPHNTLSFHGLALDGDVDVDISKVPGFLDRQCPAHATNLDAAPLRP